MSLILRIFQKSLRLSYLCLALGFCSFANPVLAQQTTAPTPTSGALPGLVLLHDGQSVYDLGPNTYTTPDETGRLSYNDLIAGHLGTHQGVVTDYNVIPLGVVGTPHWILMSVRNDTHTESRWVFSLGSHANGRYGSYSRFFIYDHLANRYLIYGMPDKAGVMPKHELLPLNGNGIPFILAPGTQALLAAYIVPESGGPVTFAPRIMTEQAFWQAQNGFLSGIGLMRTILLMVVGYFIGLMILRRNLVAVPFIIYTLAQLLLYETGNTSPYSDFPFSSEMSPLLLLLCVICGIILSKLFLDIRGVNARQGIILYGLIVASILIAGAALLAIPATSPLRAFILLGLPVFGLLFLSLLSLAQAFIAKPAAGLMAAGWLAMLVGTITSSLSMLGILNPNLMMVNAYWTGLLLQCLIFMAAAFVKVWVSEQNKKLEDEIAEEDADAIARIREAKDSSENARLLKVIEHERSILQDLRDKEMQQNEEMRRAKEGADMANRAKSAFLAVISHEIRTPMSGIMGMVRLLLETTLTKNQKDYARTIQDSGDAMLALLNDILDFEKIESGKMDLEIMDFDLLRLVNDIVTLMSGHASHKNITLKTEIDPDIPRFVRGDPVRLRQVLLNLTGNAIKFTSEGAVILTLKKPVEDAGPREGWNRIYFGIRDSGIGISKEQQKNLFNPFSQADNSISRKYGGTGLGLAICQRLVEAMGGKIMIDSIENQGSTFFFTISMENGNADHVEDVSSALAARHNAKPEKVLNILCVDDNDVNQKLLKEFVSRMGHLPTLAGSGEQALNLMKVERFDMVLMDIELPGISGMGATRAIRALPDRGKAAIPVIALTGNVRDEDIRQCYAANMNGHLAKPIEPEKLKAQIEKVLQGHLDNPVSLEQADTSTVHSQEIKIADTKPSESSSLSFEDDEETHSLSGNMPSIRAYALREEKKEVEKIEKPTAVEFSDAELDEDSFAQALTMGGKTEATAPILQAENKDIFDTSILGGLKSTMKPGDLKEMVDGLTSKNDEIITALQSAIQSGDMTAIGTRAHEMKGMSGNFGLRELARLADQIEKAAKENSPDGLSEIIASLPDANARSKIALDQWMSS
jgi:signal transduction histidine kinase/DNA-binding response OmpR family regulator/HPt (histidine-containing phosphotransfer) domain-containing protein